MIVKKISKTLEPGTVLRWTANKNPEAATTWQDYTLLHRVEGGTGWRTRVQSTNNRRCEEPRDQDIDDASFDMSLEDGYLVVLSTPTPDVDTLYRTGMLW